MKSSSCKQKGRRFQQTVANIIKAYFDLPDPDAVSTGMGQAGMDIQLSSAAREVFPYAVECKNTETLKIWEALKQAEANAQKEGLTPALFFTRNRSEAYVAIPVKTFMDLTVRRQS
ncbi:MAG: hypothetical protein LUQ50_15640 [Methanospirillum sp.]|uniref:putative PDDEXK endonuclease n=1 Tax=Methanospirillum sp. TaxID=45200 RepID=UPI002370DBC4|nr:hypothetical protein [Methanospirillum sp.]MDD1730487.1 hypothetical protein [Methanospirillum sp.]